jgi:ABC-type transport system involved in cytochrome c biogenesis permease subunit
MAEIRSMLWARVLALFIIVVGLLGTFAMMVRDMSPKGEAIKIAGYQPWSKETLAIAEKIPVQEGGRVKPLSSQAAFSMLRMRGDRTIKVQNDEGKTISIKPTAWMMDCLFRPNYAVEMPTFRVDNGMAIQAIGMEMKDQRDRYSYKQLEDSIPKLFELAQAYEKMDEKKRDAVQKQVIDLAYNVRNYQTLIGYLSFARSGIEMKAANQDGSSRYTTISAVMVMAPDILAMAREAEAAGKEIPPNLTDLLNQVLDGANFAKYGLVMLPPLESTTTEWRSAGDRIMDVMTSKVKDPTAAIEDIKMLEVAAASVSAGESQFRDDLTKMVKHFADRAEQRGEYRSIAAEASYNNRQYPLNAMIFFLIGVLCSLAMWFTVVMDLTILRKLCYGATIIFTSLGLLTMLAAISLRVYIMWRPPVGNLYDTIIFICTLMVAILLLLEKFTKQSIAATLAPLAGLGLILLARSYELGDAKDHMDPLVAVLKSNYWLTTHVIVVTSGYAVGLLTAFLSISYVLLRGLGFGGNLKKTLKLITTAAYGCLCLTLFLSLVGTVLGGIWANDSWGRFWGWDPKENGALMIVLWSLILLHARLGGLIRDWGFHLASMFMACIVSFSWWHVNFLGVGLHNYGFTSGKGAIWIFYALILLLILFGVAMWIAEQFSAKDETQASSDTTSEPAEMLY